MFRIYKILPHQIGLHFRDDQFVGVLRAGRYGKFFPFGSERIDVVSTRDVLLNHRLTAEIVRANREQNMLDGLATVLDLGDRQRALVWVDGRFFQVFGAGVHVLWNEDRQINVEIVDTNSPRFDHADFEVITRHGSAADFIEICDVKRDHNGVLFLDGRFVETLPAGRYGFWKKVADVRVVEVEMREQMLDISGQDVMTADHVTLRLNALMAYKVVNARAVVSAAQDLQSTLYREAQLVLRELVGRQSLDELLSGKDQLAADAQAQLEKRAGEFGLAVVAFGIRDVILPGEMKELLNQVTAAKKAAEANLISRREETAAIRSQANTAKLLDANPTLMRMRELEVLEKVAGSSSLQVLLGDSGSLSDRVTKLI